MDADALLCNICPKRPSFSDVSHLLTHVSSKAHLSNYFKLQIRSQQEQQAAELLDDYDLWYKENNLPKLLSDRMALKEARKKKAQGKNGKSHPVKKKAKSQAAASPKNPDSPAHPPLPTVLDPRLSNPFMTTSNTATNEDNMLYAGYTRPATPLNHVSHAHPLPVTPPRPIPTPWKQECESEPDDDSGVFLQSIPAWDMRFHGSMDTSFSLLRRSVSYDPFVEDDDCFDSPRTTEAERERADEITRLKGVLWPGMDIFDSATEPMKRKRNQKKDESVLRRMEKTSMGVQPTELVFSPTGILRKQRVISGDVDDGSPLPGETPIPKRVPRPKRVLSETDPNTHRVQTRKRSKKSTENGSSKKARVQPRRSTRVLKPSAPRFLMFRGVDHRPSRRVDDDDDFELTLRKQGPKPRRGFSVFLDEPSNHDMSAQEPDQPEPGPEISVVSRGNDLLSDSLQSTSSAHGTNLMQGPGSTSTGKGDIEPLLDVSESLDSPFDWDSPNSNQHYTSDAAFPPQYFFGDEPRVGLGLFDDHDQMPTLLAASLPKMPDEDHIYPMGTQSSNYKEPSVFRDLSPNATISDMEEEEFEQFCLNGCPSS
ncbi:uncharacterized protein EURHEDRAFT_482872 [Aspergillus ruber CBS 135680]|uniref:Uncharacterized protein n=1 Tax=Aspergillus ruber (strain CBS 135680) TaxID=1388766 RepID=A0A017S9B9_ASPRC|nr:uncharacterized protein EURHEDRAFT_482872 [Aspergillus ruber CBS 135680]EYE93229.1 hypothetical protein EURHEDRAFT_482872 [Aspergillus ruber CBS 135680]